MLYIGHSLLWVVTNKKLVSETSSFELLRLEIHEQVVHHSLGKDPPQAPHGQMG